MTMYDGRISDDDDELTCPKGFFERHTGGGCMAWEMNHDYEEDLEIWITDLDGTSMPDKTTDYVLIGFTLHSTLLHFKEGEPPIIPELLKLTDDEHDLYDCQGNYFSYGISLKKISLENVIDIVRNLSLDTFNKEVVLGLNKTKGDETR